MLALASAAAQGGAQHARGIASGVYGGEMLIGVDPATQTVSGYLRSTTGAGQFSCIFYLIGKAHRTAAAIRTYFPATPGETIAGTLASPKSGVMTVRLASEHGGCWNVQHFADDEQPAEFDLQSRYPWVSVAVVKSDRAYVFASPDSATHGKAYIAKGDGVGVRRIRKGWLQIDFIGGAKPVSGWIRAVDTYPRWRA